MTVKRLISVLSVFPDNTEIRIENNKLQILKSTIQLNEDEDEDEEWEPDMDDFGTCDVMDIY